MNPPFTRKLTAALAGVAATAGIFTGVALAAPAQAKAAPPASTGCTASMLPDRAGLNSPNPLTRAGQVDAAESASAPARGAAVSCLGH